MLVSRLPDRRALARLVRAALRHEVAQVVLTEAPRQAQPHTLDLRVGGAQALALLAEPAGAPQNGQFPLRLRPLHRAQAAELYALLEAENQETISAKPETPPPDTIAGPPAFSQDAAPIMRAMSGAAPPAIEMERPSKLPFDPKKTAPSSAFSGPMSSQPKREEVRAWTATQPSRTTDDPKRTVPSAMWPKNVVREEPGADAEDPSMSVSVIFEPSHAAEAFKSAKLPADEDGGTLSVSVVFEPDSSSVVVDINAPPSSSTVDKTVADTKAPTDGDAFFDDALANLPLPTIDEELATAPTEPPAEGADTTRPESPPDSDDDETLIRLPGGGKPGAAPPPAERPPVRPAAGRAADEDYTPTKDIPAPPKRHGTGSAPGGRKKKTTRRGKMSSQREVKRGKSGRGFDDDTAAMVGSPVEDGQSTEAGEEGDTQVGRRIADGKYVLEGLIGSGAAGAVYKATHRELRRAVAIKVLHPHYQSDEHFVKTFHGEALAASQLDHPNVMRVLDFGQEPDGLFYIVMEHLQGRTLQNLLDEERRLPPDRAIEIMIQVCAALSVAHDNGIIHRDIKPDNIMLVPSRNDEGATFELVKVCDFGIAAIANPAADDDPDAEKPVIAGTPEYMSPEQSRGGKIDARSDVYACGICLYELVTGRPPFLGQNAAEILIKGIEETPKPPSQLVKGLDPILEEIILRAIQKSPEKRHDSARELRLELKQLIDPGGEGSGVDDDGERSLIENVPVLDDPASGFPGFFIALASAVLRFGRFERAHPEAAQAMKELVKATKAALRGRTELTFARRNSQNTIGFCVMSGTAEIVDLKRLLGSQLYGSFGQPFLDAIVKKGIASMTLREGIDEHEIGYLVEMLLAQQKGDELRKEILSKNPKHVSVLFVSDVVGRDRKLSWKVGLCASRLVRDLTALSTVKGVSLKKMRESRDDLVAGVARLLNRAEEARQFLFNGDLVDDAVANLRGFSSFRVAPQIVKAMLHDSCAETTLLLIQDFDRGEIDQEVLKGYLRLFTERMLEERSPKSDIVVTELSKRSLVKDDELPRDLKESIRAQTLADALAREPAQFLRTLEMISEPDDYANELLTLEAAMAVLARRGEAGALLATVAVLARHAKTSGPKRTSRETYAERTLKTIIDKQRLVPIANVAIKGPTHQRESARQLLVHAGSAGAHALYIAREALTDASARPTFVKVFKETGPAGWSLLAALLPRMEVREEADIALVEDLLRAMPDRPDNVLGDAVAKFLTHPRLRPAALAAIVPLWGERSKKPLVDALEFAEEPARIIAVTELRRLRAIDDHVVGIVERLLTTRGAAGDELRAAAAAALGDVGATTRPRVVSFLSKVIEGKRGFVAMLRGEAGEGESAIVLEAMARSLLTLDRTEGTRAVKARIQRADGIMKARLGALLQQY